jgi:hypothetical protein
LPRSTSAPQKKKSAVLGSPTGQRQSWLANSRSERRCASEMSASLPGIVDVGLGFDHPDRTQPLLALTNPAEGAFNRPVEDVTPVFGPSSPLARPCIRRKFSDPEPMNFPKHCAFSDAAAQFPSDLSRGGAP